MRCRCGRITLRVLGAWSPSASLQVATVPGLPRSVHIDRDNSPTSDYERVKVRWKAPTDVGGSSLTGWLVRVSPIRGATGGGVVVHSNLTGPVYYDEDDRFYRVSITIPENLWGQTWYGGVRATNIVGTGEAAWSTQKADPYTPDWWDG